MHSDTAPGAPTDASASPTAIAAEVAAERVAELPAGSKRKAVASQRKKALVADAGLTMGRSAPAAKKPAAKKRPTKKTSARKAAAPKGKRKAGAKKATGKKGAKKAAKPAKKGKAKKAGGKRR